MEKLSQDIADRVLMLEMNIHSIDHLTAEDFHVIAYRIAKLMMALALKVKLR